MNYLSPVRSVFAIIAVLSVSVAFATAPQLRDVPDIQILNEESLSIDVGRYTSDIDDLLADLVFEATQDLTFGGGVSDMGVAANSTAGSPSAITPPATSAISGADSVFTLPAVAVGSSSNVGYAVTDATDSAFELSEVRGVSALIAQPSMTSDGRLSAGVQVGDTLIPYTHPVWATSAASAPNRTVASPVQIGGGTTGLTNWVVKLSRVATELVGSSTVAISNSYYTRRVVTDAAPGSALGNAMFDDNGNLSASVNSSGQVTLDPNGPFTAGAIVVGIKGIVSGSVGDTKDYRGASVLVPQLVAQFAGTQNADTGFGETIGGKDPLDPIDLPVLGTYYLDGVDATQISVPSSGIYAPLGSPGQSAWQVANPGGRFLNTDGANATVPLGQVSVASRDLVLPANLQDDRFSSGNLMVLSVTNVVEPSANPDQTQGRSAKVELENLKLEPGKVYNLSMSMYANIANVGSAYERGNINFKASVAGRAFLQVSSLVLASEANTPNGAALPTDGWRRVNVKFEPRDMAWLPSEQGDMLKENLTNVQLEMQVFGPPSTFGGTWNQDVVDLYLDNIEVYEVPGYDYEMAYGSTELFGQTRAYPNVVPATRGNLIGDFEGDNGGIAHGTLTPGRPAGYQTLVNLGWNGNLLARKRGADDPGNDAHYDVVQVVDAANHFSSPAQDGPLGRSARLHPGTVDANTQSGVRLAGQVAFDGQQAADMAAASGVGDISSLPQTVAVVAWVQAPAIYAADFRNWPSLFLSLQATNSVALDFDAVMFNSMSHVAQGEPGSWNRFVTEVDLPHGVAEQRVYNFVAFPDWGIAGVGGLDPAGPPSTWGRTFLTLEFEVSANRSFDGFFSGEVGLTGDYVAGSTAGRSSAGDGVSTGYVYLDDIAVYTTAMESTRYYDRNYFEDTSVTSILP